MRQLVRAIKYTSRKITGDANVLVPTGKFARLKVDVRIKQVSTTQHIRDLGRAHQRLLGLARYFPNHLSRSISFSGESERYTRCRQWMLQSNRRTMQGIFLSQVDQQSGYKYIKVDNSAMKADQGQSCYLTRRLSPYWPRLPCRSPYFGKSAGRTLSARTKELER